MQYFIGIDIGTTHTKAVVITGDGRHVYGTKATYATQQPAPGYEEQDAVEVFNAVVKVLQQTVVSIAGREQIACIGFSGAMHSMLAVNDRGEPLGNAVLWGDTRSRDIAEEILALPEAYTIYKETGTPVHPMSPLCKLVWMKRHQPELFAAAYKFISIKEYIFFRLFGTYIIDHSIASGTGLFNIYTRQWHAGALQLAGITTDRLSAPVPVTHAETMLPLYTGLFRLPPNTLCIAGGSDGCLANLGSGAVQHGEVALTIGTSGAVRMTVHEARPDEQQRLFNYIMTDRLFVTGGPINNGGIVLKWFAENFLQQTIDSVTGFEELVASAADAPPGAGRLLFLPYLLGERAPVWDANAKGVFFGLHMLHRKEHLARAVLEGISFTLYEIVQALESVYGPITNIYASGGFIQSPFWLQLLADIIGKRITVTSQADASATGAAFTAMLATGWLTEPETVKQLLDRNAVYEPVVRVHNHYQKQFEIFRSLYPKLKEDFKRLSELSDN